MQYQATLTQATTVIWDLFPEQKPTKDSSSPFTKIALMDLGSRGIPVSSILKIWQGLSLRLFSARLCSRMLKYLEMTSLSDAATLACDSGAGLWIVKLGRDSHHTLVIALVISQFATELCTSAKTSLRDCITHRGTTKYKYCKLFFSTLLRHLGGAIHGHTLQVLYLLFQSL